MKDLVRVASNGGAKHLIATHTVNVFGKHLDGLDSFRGVVTLFGLTLAYCDNSHKHADAVKATACARKMICDAKKLAN